MAAMVLLTFIVGCIAIKRRLGCVKKGELDAKYFRLMSGFEVPDSVTKSTRNFNNQFEVPLLFYVVGVLVVALNIESTVSIILAWLFVTFRYAHAYIHLTYNKIIHRLAAYWIALMCVLGLWINLLIMLP